MENKLNKSNAYWKLINEKGRRELRRMNRCRRCRRMTRGWKEEGRTKDQEMKRGTKKGREEDENEDLVK